MITLYQQYPEELNYRLNETATKNEVEQNLFFPEQKCFN